MIYRQFHKADSIFLDRIGLACVIFCFLTIFFGLKLKEWKLNIKFEFLFNLTIISNQRHEKIYTFSYTFS